MPKLICDRPLPSISRLRDAFDYDYDTGVFRWKALNKKGRRVRVGDAAGNFDGRYVYLHLDGMKFAAHRAALAIANGQWPSAPQIDHIDGDKRNNRLDNLRAATPGTNQQNQRRAQRSSSTGFLGVVPVKDNSSRPFRAQIWINGAAKNLGNFATALEAHEAYVLAKRRLHEGCTI